MQSRTHFESGAGPAHLSGVTRTILLQRVALDASANTNHLTFLVTNWGRPFSVAGLGNWFREVCDEAKLSGRSAHGLRKAAARRLAEAGCSALQIQAITGHKTLAEVARYTAAADQERMARDAIKRMGED